MTIEQTLSSVVVNYTRNRKDGQMRGVCFSFWYKPESVLPDRIKNKARAEIYYEYPGGSNTAIGLWVTPNETEWHMAHVNVSLRTDTTLVKVRIRGTYYGSEGFKAWIDRASLSVYYYKKENNPTYGDVTLVGGIYHSSSMQIPEFDGFVSLGISVAAKAKTGYSVYKVRDFKVELLPNNGSATTQQGRLVILYFQQKNSKGFKLDPRTSQELINSATSTGQLAYSILWIGADVIFTVVSFAFPPATVYKVLSLAWAVGGGALSSVQFVAEKVHNPLAEGGTSYAVYETLNYYTKMNYETDRIESADADYYLDWRFRTDSDDVFAIKISATVEWAQWIEGPNQWVKVGETPVSVIISIANYWQ